MSTADRLPWRKSTFSGNGEGCVDVAPASDGVFVRHTKHHEHGEIKFTHEQWAAFLAEVRAEAPSANGAAVIEKDGTHRVVSAGAVCLRFNDVEWTAFLAGINEGEFDFHLAATN